MTLAFTPPRVAVGQVVLWSYGPREKPSPAVVTAVGQGTINCACHVDSVKDHILKTGVRHARDPFLKQHPTHDSGVWELTPRDVAIDGLFALLEEHLREAVLEPPVAVADAGEDD